MLRFENVSTYLLISGLLLVGVPFAAHSQLYAGAGISTFNIHGGNGKFNGWAPTLKLEQLGSHDRIIGYLDLSYFKKQGGSGSEPIYDQAANYLGSVEHQTYHSYLYSQIGLKYLFTAKATQKKITPFAGNGLAFAYSKTNTDYSTNGSVIEKVHYKRFIVGLHFNLGFQYYLKPIILELKGNLDIDFKPLLPDSDVSNIMTNTKFSVLLPLSHH